jgi:hypothetical protein
VLCPKMYTYRYSRMMSCHFDQCMSFTAGREVERACPATDVPFALFIGNMPPHRLKVCKLLTAKLPHRSICCIDDAFGEALLKYKCTVRAGGGGKWARWWRSAVWVVGQAHAAAPFHTHHGQRAAPPLDAHHLELERIYVMAAVYPANLGIRKKTYCDAQSNQYNLQETSWHEQ